MLRIATIRSCNHYPQIYECQILVVVVEVSHLLVDLVTTDPYPEKM